MFSQRQQGEGGCALSDKYSFYKLKTLSWFIGCARVIKKKLAITSEVALHCMKQMGASIFFFKMIECVKNTAERWRKGKLLSTMKYGFKIFSFEEVKSTSCLLREVSNKSDNKFACDEEHFVHECLFYAEVTEILDKCLNKLVWYMKN